jgi:hypothetical protein
MVSKAATGKRVLKISNFSTGSEANCESQIKGHFEVVGSATKQTLKSLY